MTRLIWDERNYEWGLDRGVFFPYDSRGEVWNGLVSVDEKVAEISSRVRYRDGVKVINQRAEDSFSASIQTLSYPESFFIAYRKPFGFSYRVKTATGHKVHLVYNAIARMNDRSFEQDTVTPVEFDITTRPVAMPDLRPSAHLVIDTTATYSAVLEEFEAILYGDEDTEPRLPTPADIFSMFEESAILKVVDHEDGTFTVTGPDELIQMLDSTTFQITSNSAVYIDEVTYTLKSW